MFQNNKKHRVCLSKIYNLTYFIVYYFDNRKTKQK